MTRSPRRRLTPVNLADVAAPARLGIAARAFLVGVYLGVTFAKQWGPWRRKIGTASPVAAKTRKRRFGRHSSLWRRRRFDTLGRGSSRGHGSSDSPLLKLTTFMMHHSRLFAACVDGKRPIESCSLDGSIIFGEVPAGGAVAVPYVRREREESVARCCTVSADQCRQASNVPQSASRTFPHHPDSGLQHGPF